MELPKGFHQEVIEARENARKKVSTSLMNSGGPSYETHSLHQSKNGSLSFKLSPQLGFETTLLFGIPLVFIGYILYKYITTRSFYFLLDGIFVYLFAAYFCTTLLASLLGNLKYYTFSKSDHAYFTGFPFLSAKFAYKKYVLEDIIAIQVLGEKMVNEDTKESRNSFELNLVFKHLNRVHVIDHNNLQGMLDDAEKLSDYLNVPLWHAKSGENETTINWDN